MLATPFPSSILPFVFVQFSSVLWLPTHSNLSSVLLSQQRSLPMQDIFGSVRRSLVFRGSPENEEASSLGVGGSLVDKISYCIRSSRVFSKPSPPSPPPPSFPKNAAPPIRWRKGELIGCGAFGQVYVGMNLDSGELLAVKQVNYFLSFFLRFIVNFRFIILSSF